jgi:hypothetical protein
MSWRSQTAMDIITQLPDFVKKRLKSGVRATFFKEIDAALLCVGASGKEEAVFAEFGRFVQENVLAYCLAIDSWLRAVPAEPVTSLTTTRYIADDVVRRLALRVHTSLGEKDEVKEWLAASLLKTVKDNQRWRKRTELIDGFPQAASWFREHLPA